MAPTTEKPVSSTACRLPQRMPSLSHEDDLLCASGSSHSRKGTTSSHSRNKRMPSLSRKDDLLCASGSSHSRKGSTNSNSRNKRMPSLSRKDDLLCASGSSHSRKESANSNSRNKRMPSLSRKDDLLCASGSSHSRKESANSNSRNKRMPSLSRKDDLLCASGSSHSRNESTSSHSRRVGIVASKTDEPSETAVGRPRRGSRKSSSTCLRASVSRATSAAQSRAPRSERTSDQPRTRRKSGRSQSLGRRSKRELAGNYPLPTSDQAGSQQIKALPTPSHDQRGVKRLLSPADKQMSMKKSLSCKWLGLDGGSSRKKSLGQFLDDPLSPGSPPKAKQVSPVMLQSKFTSRRPPTTTKEEEESMFVGCATIDCEQTINDTNSEESQQVFQPSFSQSQDSGFVDKKLSLENQMGNDPRESNITLCTEKSLQPRNLSRKPSVLKQLNSLLPTTIFGRDPGPRQLLRTVSGESMFSGFGLDPEGPTRRLLRTVSGDSILSALNLGGDSERPTPERLPSRDNIMQLTLDGIVTQGVIRKMSSEDIYRFVEGLNLGTKSSAIKNKTQEQASD